MNIQIKQPVAILGFGVEGQSALSFLKSQGISDITICDNRDSLDIENGINANNQNIPGGEVVMGENSFNVKTSGSYESLDEIRNTVVGSVEGQLVYLKDIAVVR